MTEAVDSVLRRLRWHSGRHAEAAQAGERDTAERQLRSCDKQLDELLDLRPELRSKDDEEEPTP